MEGGEFSSLDWFLGKSGKGRKLQGLLNYGIRSLKTEEGGGKILEVNK